MTINGTHLTKDIGGVSNDTAVPYGLVQAGGRVGLRPCPHHEHRPNAGVVHHQGHTHFSASMTTGGSCLGATACSYKSEAAAHTVTSTCMLHQYASDY